MLQKSILLDFLLNQIQKKQVLPQFRDLFYTRVKMKF